MKGGLCRLLQRYKQGISVPVRKNRPEGRFCIITLFVIYKNEKEKTKMKKLSLIVLALLCLMTSCVGEVNEGVWSSATYTEDTTFGTGAATVTVEVKAGDKSIDFVLKTDKTTLGDALIEHGLIEGEEGQYGLYIKKVNGITADFDVDQSYWAFYKNGETMMSGVDGTEIKDGEHYELVYTKS